jgi:serine/threonine protein kinase
MADTNSHSRGTSTPDDSAALSSSSSHRVGLSLATEQAPSQHKYAEHYTTLEKLAKGSYGTVYLAEHVATHDHYAVKVIERSRLSARDKDLVQREVAIMKDCRDVENVVTLVDYFVSPQIFHVVQVLAQGGTWRRPRSVGLLAKINVYARAVGPPLQWFFVFTTTHHRSLSQTQSRLVACLDVLFLVAPQRYRRCL